MTDSATDYLNDNSGTTKMYWLNKCRSYCLLRLFRLNYGYVETRKIIVRLEETPRDLFTTHITYIDKI